MARPLINISHYYAPRRVTRADVASVLVAAILDPDHATGLRFDLSSDPDQPASGDFRALFREARDWGGSWKQSTAAQ